MSNTASSSDALKEYYQDNDLAMSILRRKYLLPEEKTLDDLWHRVATAIASVEDDSSGYADKFYHMLKDFLFIPGGRIMHGAGRPCNGRSPTLTNCYVIPILEDSLEGIYKCMTEAALVYRTGGGVGTDLSVLRPKGATVNASITTSPGCTTFMNLLSESTNTVSQAGRRGALILTLRVDHPDIIDFIAIKDDRDHTYVQYANISVLITDEFMDAVKYDTPFDLRWGGTVYNTVRARDLWDSIVKHAHRSAEPGLIFWDTMRRGHLMENITPLAGTNPCGEQPLPAYGACNLGHINLRALVAAYEVDIDDLVALAVRFMDDVITYNHSNHALPEIKEAVAGDRRIGLGITGLADAFVMCGLRYGSAESVNWINDVMADIRSAAFRASIDLAKERGAFPFFDYDRLNKEALSALPEGIQKDIATYGLRNASLLTVAPVGTGSIIAQTSSGIEPIYQLSYERRVKEDDGHSYKTFKAVHPIMRTLNIDVNDPSAIPEYVVTAYDIDAKARIDIQSVIQQYVDSSISSTINLPSTADEDEISRIFLNAYDYHLKGITIYRDGSREGILTSHKEEHAVVPRKRPDVTRGVTERIVTGEGKLYVTINEDDTGLCEVFGTIGKSGGAAAAQSEAISRLISLVLRSGVDPNEVVKELKGIAGPNPVWHNGELVLSTPDAIGRAIERHLRSTGRLDAAIEKTEHVVQCPECGAEIQYEGGCISCHSCGWSQCG